MLSIPPEPRRVLILGGTTEARQLAERLAHRTDLAVTLSLAGRTRAPLRQPVPVRIGGFGGVDGLAATLRAEHIALLIDATHPFAARISANAVAASAQVCVPLLVLRRPEWKQRPGDTWHLADSVAVALALVGTAPRCVFVALGRQELAPLEAVPQHHFVIRSVDPVEPPPALPQVRYLLDRGPFAKQDELQLLRENRIDAIVCKNSGGAASYGKIAAARELGIPVFMVRRPPIASETVNTVEVTLARLDQLLAPMYRGE